MPIVTKLIAWAALIAAVGLTVFDFFTSIMGIHQVLGEGDGGPIARFMPIFFAVLAVSFNAVSSYVFRMYLTKKFTSFSSTVAFSLWVFFLIYDALSSFAGLLKTYAGTPIYSWETAVSGIEQLGPLASFFVIVMAALLSFGPFLVSLFSELAMGDTQEA